MGKTHAWSGLAAGLAVGLWSGDIAVTAVCGAVGLGTSWGPDFDHPNARAVKVLGPIGWLLCRGIRGLSRAFGLPTHRGLSHTLLFAVLVGVAAWVTVSQWGAAVSPWLVGGAASAGVCAALAGDFVTKQSLPHLLWPLSRVGGPPRGLRVTTGKRVERWVVFPLVAAGCGWLVYTALIHY